ncbi:MAG: hypothetical protein ACE367_11765 [Acidimicrobiales bacterium]
MSSDPLRRWIVDELTSARARLAGGVIDMIPSDEMTVLADNGGVPGGYALWHLARHHDVAVNAVLRGRDEVVLDHLGALGVHDRLYRGLAEGADTDLVAVLDPDAVAAYALATLDDTIAWVATEASLEDLDDVPDSARALRALGTPEDDFDWLYRMWSDKPRRWFLSWSAIGHVVTHTGELVGIRNRLGHNPF